jgi:organic radical activating enzyme
MKIKPSEGNTTFCMAPFSHTYLSPQSERRLCCASREKATWATQYIDSEKADNNSNYKPTTLDEHWNSPYMMDIRKKLMAGEEIPQCNVCNQKILNIHIYRDYFTKTLFPHKIDEAFEKTREDGYTEMKPISFDYRISNLCNFKCRMCGDQLSSSWEAENRMMGHYDNGGDAWALKENKPIIDKFQAEVAEKELWDAVYEKRIEEIYWVGGEPLMWEIHWDIMKYLVDTGQAKDVIVRYNTNLSRVKYKNHNLYDYLPHFKSVQICASIDGIGENVEYVRHGVKWDSWIQNFKDGLFLNEKFGSYAIAFDLTLTSPGLFSMKQMIDITAELDVHTLIKTTFAFDSSIVMSPMMIPRHILEPILDDIIEYAKEKSKINPKIENYVTCFEDIRGKLTFQEEFPNWETGIKNGKQRLNKIDEYRGNLGKIEKIFSEYPPLLEWWNTI